MDLFERLFSFSPDNGSGSAEWITLAVIAALIAVFFTMRHRGAH